MLIAWNQLRRRRGASGRKYANKKSQTIERQLNAILEDDATIKKAEHIPKFVKLMQGPRSIMVKGVLLNVLNASAKHPALL